MEFRTKREAEEATDMAMRKAVEYQRLRDSEKGSLTLWHHHNRDMHDALKDARDIRALLPTLPE